MKHKLLQGAAISLLFLAIFVGGLEFVARRYFPKSRRKESVDSQRIQFLLENYGPFFRTSETGGQKRLIQVPHVLMTTLGQDIPLDKATGQRRIVFIGESSADMLAGHFSRMIQSGPLAQSIEVMDSADGGGDLELVERRFDEIMNYSPDIIVILFGHNLFYHHPYMAPWRYRLGLWLSRSRFIELLQRRISRQETYEPPYPEASRWRSLEIFLHRAARRAKLRNIPIIVCTVPSNLWLIPQSEDRERNDPRYLHSLFLADTGQTKKAIKELKEAAAAKNSALWHFQLGYLLYQEGSYPEAYSELTLARDLDPSRHRASGTVNSFIRRIASEEHLGLLDAEQLIHDQAPHGIPGWESFYDNQHVDSASFDYEALTLRELIQRRYISPKMFSPGDNPVPNFPTITPSLSFADRLRWALISLSDSSSWQSLIYMLQVQKHLTVQEGVSAIQRWVDDPHQQTQAYYCLAEAFWRMGRQSEAREINQRITESEKDSDLGYLQQGLFALRSKRFREARQCFTKAHKINPGSVEAAYFLTALGPDKSAFRPGFRTSGRDGNREILLKER
jgi:tetratricopeptide (TPR) repeat protein